MQPRCSRPRGGPRSPPIVIGGGDSLVSPPLADASLPPPAADPSRPLPPSPYAPLPSSSVTFKQGSFWRAKQRRIALSTLPAIWEQLVQTRRIEYLRGVWKEGMPFKPQKWDESDVTKFIEAASGALTHDPPNAVFLRSCIEQALDALLSTQQADGYLNAFLLSTLGPDRRFTNLRDLHELYNLGHLIEATVAYARLPDAQHERPLGAVRRYLVLVERELGVDAAGPGRAAYPGHQELELALIKLAESGLGGAEESARWLRLAQGFIEQRGRGGQLPETAGEGGRCRSPRDRSDDDDDDEWVAVERPPRTEDRSPRREDGELFFDWELRRQGGDPFKDPSFWGMPWHEAYFYMQAHLPIREQTAVRGHAVRVVYWLTAATDLARHTRDASLLRTVHTLWADMERKTYVTGGIGADPATEGFSDLAYHLPNEPGAIYAETCAAIGVIFLAHRLLQIHLHGAFADRLEWTLWNAVLPGISADGKRFFYDNPLEVHGNKTTQRAEWFSCSCCPPNVSRLISTLGTYVCSASPSLSSDAGQSAAIVLAVHQYVACEISLDAHGLPGGKLVIETQYPFEGDVGIRFEGCEGRTVGLKLRVPVWAGTDWTLSVDGVSRGRPAVVDGYLTLPATQRLATTSILLAFELRAKAIRPHPLVSANTNRLAFHRGPLLLAIETADHPNDDLRTLRVRDPKKCEHPSQVGVTEEGLLKVTLAGSRVVVQGGEQRTERCNLHLIPYHDWGNRGLGDLMVWIPKEDTDSV